MRKWLLGRLLVWADLFICSRNSPLISVERHVTFGLAVCFFDFSGVWLPCL